MYWVLLNIPLYACWHDAKECIVVMVVVNFILALQDDNSLKMTVNTANYTVCYASNLHRYVAYGSPLRRLKS